MISIPSFDGAGTPPPDAVWKPWADLLMQRCGLALREPQIPALVEIVKARRGARGLTSDAAYYELLASEAEGETEWIEVVDRLVSHETSFFRHPPSFDALRTAIMPELRKRPEAAGQYLSLCSAGCSTGEEAYSMAMIAMEECARGREFIVWGSDISRRAIDAARKGRYSEKALSAVPAPYRQQHFRSAASNGTRQFDIADDVRRRVRFLAVNLYASGGVFLNYDVIFCQNVLIYFAPQAVPRLVSLLGARLTPGGYLVLGPGEAPLECPAGLEPQTLTGVRAFRRTAVAAREVRT
jgi:chemotaxis methyl-accepting protein methylase